MGCIKSTTAVKGSVKKDVGSASTTYELYFAIGSMMNKVSLNNRKLSPVESQPA